ncbi:MAG: outer membrane protein [Xanthobacteraceae bacterium]
MAGAADQLPPTPFVRELPPAIYNWTGIYVGAHAGYGWGRTQGFLNFLTDFFPLDAAAQNVAGAIAGAQIGVNHQLGRAVIGLELSGSWSNVRGTSDCVTFNVIANVQTSSCDIRQPWSAQLLGRFGYVPVDGRFFPYLLAGVAFAQLNAAFQVSGPSPPVGSTLGTIVAAWGSSKPHQGGVVGAGLQYAIFPGLSVGAEYTIAIYDVQDQGSKTNVTTLFNCCGVPQTDTFSHRLATPLNLTVSTARVIMNYTFE